MRLIDGKELKVVKWGEWIPCSERLPKIICTVIVSYRRRVKFKNVKYNYYIEFAYLSGFGYKDEPLWHVRGVRWQDNIEVLAWMPAPGIYKEHDEETDDAGQIL